MTALRRMLARKARDLGEQAQLLARRVREVDDDAARDVMRAATLLRGVAHTIGRSAAYGGSTSWEPDGDR